MSDPGPWATPGEDGPADDPARVPGEAPPPPPPPPDMPPPPAPGGAPRPPGVPPPPGHGYRTPPPTRQRVGLVPLYPMGVGDVLDTAFRLLRACAGPAVLLVLVLLGPVQVLTSTAFVSPTSILQDPVPEAVDGRLVALSLVGAALSLVVVPLAAAALTWLAARADESSVPDWREALRHGARRYWATLGAWALLVLVAVVAMVAVGLLVGLLAAAGSDVLAVLVAIPLGLGALLLVIGLTALAYLTVPCVVVEQLGPRQGVARAWQLLRRRFWPTIGVSLAVGLVVSLLGGAVSSAISIPAFFGFPGAWVFVAIGGILDRLITVPLGAFAALAIHVDQRIRTEGYDVAVLVSELRQPGVGATHASPPADPR